MSTADAQPTDVSPTGVGPTASALSDELTGALFAADPLHATLAGVHGPHDAELPDLTEPAERALADRLRGLAARAAAADRPELPAADRLTLDTARVIAADGADLADCRLPEWRVSNRWTAPAGVLLVELPHVTLPEPAQAAAYLRRLAAIDGYLAAAGERHLAGLAAGRTPMARLVRAAIDQIDGYLAAGDRDPFLGPLPAEAAERRAAESVLADTVRPAFRRYRQLLADRLAPHGRDDEHGGLCWLPGGADVYRTLVRTHTTSTRTPEDLHRAGHELIARLAEEYARIGGRVLGTTDPAEVMRRMREDPALRCTSAEQMLADSRAAIARAEAAAPRWFAQVPGQPCEVRSVPPADAAATGLAYYTAPPLDGSKPGTYWLDTGNPTGQPRHVLEFTAFHEGVPGHHFQTVVNQAQQDVPLLRKVHVFDAHDEGWALYCERLADEMGLYSGDLARLGMLAGDSMRAARLVVDTGMHALGWSRARTVDYLRANTPMPLPDIENETDRYLAVPGQALAYMVGRLEIERLRANAERRLGAAFDIRRFHHAVLSSGSMPLTTLAAHLDRWA
jgi:uncharacterized protein (DUF885 family)